MIIFLFDVHKKKTLQAETIQILSRFVPIQTNLSVTNEPQQQELVKEIIKINR